MKKILRSNLGSIGAIGRLLPLSLASLFLLLNIFFINENPLRGSVVIFLLLLWTLSYFSTKSSVKASLFLLLFVIPLNITITFPSLGDVYVRGVYSNYLSPTLSIIDLFVSLLFASLLVTPFSKSITVIHKLVFAVLILSLLSQLSVISLVGTLRIGIYLASGLLLANYLREREDGQVKRGVLIILSLAVTIQVLIASLQVYLGKDLGLQFIGESQLTLGTIGSSFIALSEATYLRGYGTFPHPNLLAAFLSLTIILLMAHPHKDRLIWYTLVISFFGLLLTFSRLGWVLVIICIAIYLFINWKNRQHVNSFSLSIFGERLLNLISSTDSSVRDRYLLIGHSIDVIRKEGLWGVGNSNYVSTMRELPIYTNNGLFLLQPVHNIFLLMIAEMGIWGVLLVLAILYKILFYNWKRHSFFLYLGLLLFILTFGMFDHFLLTLPQGLVMLILVLLL